MEQAYLIARSLGEHGFALLQLDQIPAGHTSGGAEFQWDFLDGLCVHLSVPVIRRAFEPMFEIIRFQENVFDAARFKTTGGKIKSNPPATAFQRPVDFRVRARSRLARSRSVRVSASSSHSSFSRKVRLRSSNRSNSRLPSGVPQRQSGSMSNGCFIERVAILQCPSNPAGGRRHASFSEAFPASPLAPKRRGKLQAGQPAKIQRQNQTVHK